MAATMTEQEMWEELCAADDERVAAYLAEEDGNDGDDDPAPTGCGREWYYRVVPAGASIFGWTSEGSDRPLRDGFIFAYESANELMAGQLENGLYGEEVVAFEGDLRYQPGDAEGVGVKPWAERKRWTLREFADRRREYNAPAFRRYLAEAGY